MKKIQSGQGATDFGATYRVEPIRTLEGAPPGKRPTQIKPLGDPNTPLSPRLAEAEEYVTGETPLAEDNRAPFPSIQVLINGALSTQPDSATVLLAMALQEVIKYLEER